MDKGPKRTSLSELAYELTFVALQRLVGVVKVPQWHRFLWGPFYIFQLQRNHRRIRVWLKIKLLWRDPVIKSVFENGLRTRNSFFYNLLIDDLFVIAEMIQSTFNFLGQRTPRKQEVMGSYLAGSWAALSFFLLRSVVLNRSLREGLIYLEKWMPSCVAWGKKTSLINAVLAKRVNFLQSFCSHGRIPT